ncbi:MAG: SWIM zinc finger family protein [Myxococcota bacterium]
MRIEFRYAGQSGVVAGLRSTQVAFATNQLREAAFFRGELGRPLVLRDALAALHAVVVSDLRYRPRDRLAFREWLEEQDRRFLQNLALKSDELRQDIELREARLDELNQARRATMQPFFTARKKYFEHVYHDTWEIEMLLDPVITVHPDEVSFEAFSKDESSYARVAAKYDVFKKIDEFACGTTNVDFSIRLHTQLDRMRSYRDTRFDIDAGGFTVTNVSDGAHREKKIDVPESWVNGFLQVQSVMTLGLKRLRLEPVDIFNICRFLVRHKAKEAPRALRFELEPGKRARAVFEPWDHAIELSPIYEGEKREFIRTWGRERLRVFERLLPVTKHIDLYLAGHGLPTIYVADLGDVTFTLGLSGWTEQDWTGQNRFGLLSRRLDASADDLSAVYHRLRDARYGAAATLGNELGLGTEKTRAALAFLCQSGRAMFDLSSGVYRHRDLFFAPFDAKKIIAKAKALEESSDPKAKAARQVFEAGQARMTARRPSKGGYKLSGSVRGTDNERVRPLLRVDAEGQIIEATCTCRYFKKYRLTKGPCEHMLALRLAHMAKLAEEDMKGGA